MMKTDRDYNAVIKNIGFLNFYLFKTLSDFFFK
jgi:hypothetical protein